MTCAICACRDDDACPEVCSWDDDAPLRAARDVPICSSCVHMADELGRLAHELANQHRHRQPDGKYRRLKPEALGWRLLVWLTLEPDGPGAVLGRWAQAEPWSKEPGGLLEGRKEWWHARGSKGPKSHRARRKVAKR